MKRLLSVLVVLILTCVFIGALGETAEEKKEITFRNIPWGSSYETVNADNSGWNLRMYAGDFYDVKSVANVLSGGSDYTKDYEYKDINIIASGSGVNINVAGYTATTVKLYFAYTPVDGVLTRTTKDSSMYGALYGFDKVNNVEPIEHDLIEKLSKIYGEPSKTDESKSWSGNKIRQTYWYGANDTVVCLHVIASKDSEDSSFDICYAWLKGDDLLAAANQSEIDRIAAGEQAVQDLIDQNSDNLDGL